MTQREVTGGLQGLSSWVLSPATLAGQSVTGMNVQKNQLPKYRTREAGSQLYCVKDLGWGEGVTVASVDHEVSRSLQRDSAASREVSPLTQTAWKAKHPGE